jgi:hypothetical protein
VEGPQARRFAGCLEGFQFLGHLSINAHLCIIVHQRGLRSKV